MPLTHDNEILPIAPRRGHQLTHDQKSQINAAFASRSDTANAKKVHAIHDIGTFRYFDLHDGKARTDGINGDDKDGVAAEREAADWDLNKDKAVVEETMKKDDGPYRLKLVATSEPLVESTKLHVHLISHTPKVLGAPPQHMLPEALRLRPGQVAASLALLHLGLGSRVTTGSAGFGSHRP
ncbi:hypothetical protein PG990_007088 [Apiospora arundinis]